MTIKVTTPTNGGDSVEFGSGITPIAAEVTGSEVSSGEGKLELKTTAGGTSATKVTVLANGNVGIGTAPIAKLTTDSGDIAISSTQASDNGDLGEFQFWNRTNAGSGSGTSFVNDVAAIKGQMEGTGNNSGGSLHFYTKPDGETKTEKMTIDGVGAVGIGTSTPSTGYGGAISNVKLALRGAGAGGNNGTATLLVGGDNNHYSSITSEHTGGGLTYLSFGTSPNAGNPTEKMRITSAGDLKFNSGYGSAATAYGCRAWVNFNGTGTVAIREDGNVSSITDNGTGNYTVNFAVAMPDVNYAVMGLASSTMTGRTADVSPYFSGTYTAAATQFLVKDSADVTIDTVHVSIAILR